MAPNPADSHTLCGAWLEQLTGDDLDQLRAFAEHRLQRLGLPAATGHDLVSKALNSVIKGLTTGQEGRRPRPDDVVDKEVFLNFLRGAVCSTVEAFSRKREHRHQHQPIEPWDGSNGQSPREIEAPSCPDRDMEFIDLKRELFGRLRKRAPARLQHIIDLWEEIFFWADRIPCAGNPKHAYQVRLLARRILQEIDGEINQSLPRRAVRMLLK